MWKVIYNYSKSKLHRLGWMSAGSVVWSSLHKHKENDSLISGTCYRNVYIKGCCGNDHKKGRETKYVQSHDGTVCLRILQYGLQWKGNSFKFNVCWGWRVGFIEKNICWSSRRPVFCSQLHIGQLTAACISSSRDLTSSSGLLFLKVFMILTWNRRQALILYRKWTKKMTQIFPGWMCSIVILP